MIGVVDASGNDRGVVVPGAFSDVGLPVPLAGLRGAHHHSPGATRVEYGAGCVESLQSELQRLGIRRALLLSTRSLAREQQLLERVRAILSEALVGEFLECEAHVPETVAARALRFAREHDADGLVAFGGSSVIDTAKVVSLGLGDGVKDLEQLARWRSGAPPSAIAGPPTLALPTTLSGAEMTAVVATTDAAGVKHLLQDARCAVASAFLDPSLTSATPRLLWLSTGVKTFSDAIERVCSPGSSPVSDAVCTTAIGWMLDALPRSVSHDSQSRLLCQLASWLALFEMHPEGASVGLGAALRHQVAVMCRIPHGEATCALLPHVLRFNLPVLPERTERLARAMGLGSDRGQLKEAGVSDDACVDAVLGCVQQFIDTLGLPRRLSEVSSTRPDFDVLVERVLAEAATSRNPRAVQSAAEVRKIVEDAW